MDVNGIINVLRTMESQMEEIREQNARINSIQRTINNLKKEQALLKMPEKPVLQTPKSVVSGFLLDRAAAVYLLSLCIFFGIYNFCFPELFKNDGKSMGTIALLISFVPAIIAGKMGARQRKKWAEEKELQRVRGLNRYLSSNWKQERQRIQTQKAQITRQLVQLETEYRTAVQVEQELQAKLSESGYSIGLHPDYWTSDALYQIRSLLDHGRADTLKEAINRYEAEKWQRKVEQDRQDLEWERMQMEESYRREQLEAAQRQADAAETQAEYERQQSRHAAAIRDDVARMRDQQEWDRLFGR